MTDFKAVALFAIMLAMGFVALVNALANTL